MADFTSNCFDFHYLRQLPVHYTVFSLAINALTPKIFIILTILKHVASKLISTRTPSRPRCKPISYMKLAGIPEFDAMRAHLRGITWPYVANNQVLVVTGGA